MDLINKFGSIPLSSDKVYVNFHFEDKYTLLLPNNKVVYLDYSTVKESYFSFLEPIIFLLDYYINKYTAITSGDIKDIRNNIKKVLSFWKNNKKLSLLLKYLTVDEIILIALLLKCVRVENNYKYDLQHFVGILMDERGEGVKDVENDLSGGDNGKSKEVQNKININRSFTKYSYSAGLSIYRRIIPFKLRQKIKNILMNTSNY